MGPTASGKTDLALEIAQHYPIEVISVDSALVYREMNIGTAKPDKEFLKKLPHFLIDICNPDQVYSAADFRRDALQKMQEITTRGNIPLLVGGTMLYFKVLLEGLADIPEVSPGIRETILNEAELHGWPALHEELQKVDPEAAQRIHPNHSQRIQRALEVFRGTGKSLSEFHQEQNEQLFDFRVLQIVLMGDRKVLHQRIEQRFAQMLEQGFIEEVRGLRSNYQLNPELPSMRAVGYRQVWQFLDGEFDRDDLYEKGCAATRQLAKRQHTWLRKWPNLQLLDTNRRDSRQQYGQIASLLEQIHSLCAEFDISRSN